MLRSTYQQVHLSASSILARRQFENSVHTAAHFILIDRQALLIDYPMSFNELYIYHIPNLSTEAIADGYASGTRREEGFVTAKFFDIDNFIDMTIVHGPNMLFYGQK